MLTFREVAKSILAQGDNYCVELDGAIASCRVWSRPDLDCDTGARLAAQKVAICRSLAAGEARGMLFDLRDAPKVTGPKTQKSLGSILEAWELRGRPIAIVVSPASLQKLQLARIARDAAPRHAEVFVDVEQARAWLERRGSENQQPRHHSAVSAASAELRLLPDGTPSLEAARAGSLRARPAAPVKRRT
jgi:hypothetical protein